MLKQTIGLLTKNLRPLLQFEIVYKLFALFVVLPLLALYLKRIMSLTGYPYLDLGNLLSFLINPLTILFLLFAIFILTAYTMLDIAFIVIVLDQSRQNHKISTWDATKFAFHKLKKLLRRRNFLLPLVILVLLPFLDIGLAFGVGLRFEIPEFISDFIASHIPLLIIVLIFFAALIFLAIRWMYSFHYYILDDSDFKTARQQSQNLIKHHALKDAFVLLLAQLIYLIIAFAFLGLCFLLLWLTDLAFAGWLSSNDLALNIFITIFNIFIIILVLTSTPYIYAIISVRFYQRKTQKHEKITRLTVPITTPKTSTKILRAGSVVTILIFSGLIYFTLDAGKYTFNTPTTTPEIVAHRGFSAEYPENTMPAFEAAVAAGADWLELDVHETKDDQIVISHDSNLKHASGVDKNIWDSTYDEIKDLNLSQGRDAQFPDYHIPLLSELLAYAQATHVRLNIELKHSGHERNLEQATIDLIRQYHLEDQVVLGSIHYPMLKKSKSIAPEIPTLYIMAFAYGDVTTISSVDGFSIEASSVTSELIDTIHNANKKIYVWTVDSDDTIKHLQELGVDGIITNDPKNARTVLEENSLQFF